MNLFRKQFRNFTNRRFDVFSDQRFVNLQLRLSSSFGVGFAWDLQSQLVYFKQIIFPFVKIVACTGKQLRHFRQLKRQFRQTLQVSTTAGQNTKLQRDAVAGCQNLHSDTVKVAVFRGHFSAILFITNDAAAPDANVVAYGNRERIKHIAGVPMKFFQHTTQLMKKSTNQIAQAR